MRIQRWIVAIILLGLYTIPSGVSAAEQAVGTSQNVADFAGRQQATPETPAVPKFNISPADDDSRWFDVTVEPGDTTHLTAKIENFGSVSASLTTFVTNAINPPNGGFGITEDGGEPMGPTRWLEYPGQTFILKPGQIQEIKFAVSVPPETPPGFYVTALLVETADSLEIPGSETFRQVIRSAVSVEITVPGEMTSGFELGDPIVTAAGSQWLLDVPVTNTGTARVRPQGELVVTTPDGEEVSSTDVEMGSVYGGNSTSVRVTLPEQLPLGDYLVSLDLTDPDTGATASIEEVPIALAEAEEAPAFVVDEVSVTPNGDPVQYADVAATITNTGQAIPTANVTLNVQRDGEEVESYPLAENQALPTGSTDFSQRYIPVDGWQPGTYTFELVISAVSGDTETVLATIDVDDEIVVP